MICKTLWSMLVSFATVLNNPSSQWLLATKFYFRLTLWFGCRSVWAWLLLTCLILSPRMKKRPPFWSCHSHSRRNRARGLVETFLDSQGFCSDVAYISSSYMPLAKKPHVWTPHQGASACMPLTGGAANHLATGGRRNIADNSIIYDSSLVRQGVSREDFPKSFTSPFALSTNKLAQKGV